MKIRLKAIDGIIYTGTKIGNNPNMMSLTDVTYSTQHGEIAFSQGNKKVYFNIDQIIWYYEIEK